MDGAIRLSVAPRALPDAPLNFVWSAAPDGEAGLLLGGGVGGRIVRIGAEPSEQTYPSLPGAFVTALARSENGDLYAGLSPEGTLCRVGQRGYETIAQLNARYVNAMRGTTACCISRRACPRKCWHGTATRCDDC